VVDDFVRGRHENVADAVGTGRVNVVEGDIRDAELVDRLTDGCDLVFHQAAHKAVLRSVERPLITDTVNTHGTLTILKAALDAGVGRVVHASSSSVYGGAATLPTTETEPTNPRSPYAVSKLAAEHYCRIFSELYGLETVALRYFNVYGPRQRPDATYAAVIPLFVDALLRGRRPVVHGDGLQSRDFTFISDVVEANLAAAVAPADRGAGHAYNIAGGASSTLLDILAILGDLLGVVPDPEFVEPRAGDVRHSRADATAAARDLEFRTRVGLADGLRLTVDWLRSLG